MNVSEIEHLALTNKEKKIRLYNPDTDDFTVSFDDGTGKKDYTIKALEMAEFPLSVGLHIKKHLAHRLLYKHTEKVNPEEDLLRYYKEIEVNLE